MHMGVQTYTLSARSPAKPVEQNLHGSHHHILPSSGVPSQRTNRPGQPWHPLVQGQALHLHGVPQDGQRNERYVNP